MDSSDLYGELLVKKMVTYYLVEAVNEKNQNRPSGDEVVECLSFLRHCDAPLMPDETGVSTFYICSDCGDDLVEVVEVVVFDNDAP